MRLFSRLTELLGSITVLFLFFSGFALLLFFLVLAVVRRGKKSENNIRKRGVIKKYGQTEVKRNTHSPFGSLCLALAGTLGVGNISGVAAAIAIGGAGAVFWMWVSAVFCSALKFAEVVLAVRYRNRMEDGYYEGGAHLYIEKGLGARGVAVVFCALCVFASFTIGNVTQINAAAQSLRFSLGLNEYLCGAVCLVLLLLFCRSGSTIYSFTLRAIPLLCLGYVALSIVVLVRNTNEIGAVTRLIIESAFNTRAGAGGVMGMLCGKAVRVGITRGVMSNEAGCGTAPIAHASADVRSPFAQGVLGVAEVLFDTLFLCTLTAYVILLSDITLADGASTVNAISAFSEVLGEWVKVPLSISMLLFAIGSAVGWNYYGRISLSYLGAGKGAMLIYGFSYAACAFFGAGLSEGIIWNLSDISIYLMSLINTSAVLLLIVFTRKSKNRIDIHRTR